MEQKTPHFNSIWIFLHVELWFYQNLKQAEKAAFGEFFN